MCKYPATKSLQPPVLEFINSQRRKSLRANLKSRRSGFSHLGPIGFGRGGWNDSRNRLLPSTNDHFFTLLDLLQNSRQVRFGFVNCDCHIMNIDQLLIKSRLLSGRLCFPAFVFLNDFAVHDFAKPLRLPRLYRLTWRWDFYVNCRG